jgi:hypothetical protein
MSALAQQRGGAQNITRIEKNMITIAGAVK